MEQWNNNGIAMTNGVFHFINEMLRASDNQEPPRIEWFIN